MPLDHRPNLNQELEMRTPIFIDIETRSPNKVNLPATGIGPYMVDAEVELICWAVGETGEVEEGLDGLLDVLNDCGREDVVLVAQNSLFEQSIFKHNDLSDYQSLVTDYDWLCTMRMAAWLGFPMGLDKMGQYLHGFSKHAEGREVLERIIKDPTYELSDSERTLLIDYCKKDVELTRFVFYTMSLLMQDPVERDAFMAQQAADVAINLRGVPVDTELMLAAALRADSIVERANKDVQFVTKKDFKASARAKIVTWLKGQAYEVGADLPVPVKHTVNDVADMALAASFLGRKDGKRLARAVRVGGSTSLAKYRAAAQRQWDGRLHGCFAFAAAANGRWISRGVQIHNVPRSRNPLDPQSCKTAKASELAGGMRSMVAVKDPSRLAIADYSQIELRILLWVADESVALLQMGDGHDPYKTTASRIFNVKRVTKDMRQTAKAVSVGLGYGMGVKALASYTRVSESEARDISQAYHEAFPGVRELHKRIELLVTDAAEGKVVKETRVSENADVSVWTETALKDTHRKRRCLCIRLPSRRVLRLWEPDDTDGARAWSHGSPVKLWGGGITEYIVCGIARDLLARAITRAEDAGMSVVSHIHDELLIELSEGELRQMGRLAADTSPWGDTAVQGPQVAVDMVTGIMTSVDANDPYEGLPLAVEARVSTTWGQDSV